MKVFYFNANEVSDNEIEKILSHSEEYRIRRYKRSTSEIAGRETLCAGFLLKYAVSRYASVPFDSVESSYAPSGKPVLVSPESITQLYVSLTHTQGHIFCAVSGTPVGIDAEHLRSFDKGLADRFFNERERNYLESEKNDDEMRVRFFEIWTAKEACFKQGTNGINSFLEADFTSVHKKASKRYGELMLTVVGDINSPEIEEVTERSLDVFDK